MKIKLLTLALVAILFSCSGDDDQGNNSNITECIPASTMEVTISEEFQHSFGFKEVYSAGNYTVSVPYFVTPNGDGVRDSFVIYIKNTETGTSFISSDSDIIESADGAVTNPEGLITSANLTIGNNCEQVFETADIYRLWWNVLLETNEAKGIYNFDLHVVMEDGTIIDVSDTFEVLDTVYE